LKEKLYTDRQQWKIEERMIFNREQPFPTDFLSFIFGNIPDVEAGKIQTISKSVNNIRANNVVRIII